MSWGIYDDTIRRDTGREEQGRGGGQGYLVDMFWLYRWVATQCATKQHHRMPELFGGRWVWLPHIQGPKNPPETAPRYDVILNMDAPGH